MQGAYTWSNINVKEKVGLSVGAYTRGSYKQENTILLQLYANGSLHRR